MQYTLNRAGRTPTEHDVVPLRPFTVYTERQLDRIEALQGLPDEQIFAMRVVAHVLPFRVNRYVIDELIDWSNIPDDPVFQLTFPQPGMLSPEDFQRMAQALGNNASREQIRDVATSIRAGLNPQPDGQRLLNIPRMDGENLEGMQHKYEHTVLFFPSQGQTCHSYCTFCFRWAQFIGSKELRFSSSETSKLFSYLRRHSEVTDLLVTGGDPMVMRTNHLKDYLQPLLTPELAHITSLRIGTKSLTFWPHRYVTDDDADELLRLFERLVKAGKHVALMAHINHWQELDTPMVREAVRRLRSAGVIIRSQAPVLAHINDDAGVWSRLWKTQVGLGIQPYYMFVERDTGARRYFQIPLLRAYEIYRDAIRQVSGLARTARGPSMSAAPGKVEVQGIAEVAGEKVFVLRFLQARNNEWTHRPFFARFDPEATWLDQLRPAFGEERFFFQDEHDRMS